MNLWKLYWKTLHLLGYYDRRKKDVWVDDTEHKLKINPRTIVLEADRNQSLHFNKDAALKEEAALLPFINIDLHSRVLDLGCGDGRWAKKLAGSCKEFVGVDFSGKFIDKAHRNVADANARFICLPAQEYYVDEKYDLILVIGLLTYLNDEDIIKLSNNCRRMLGSNGRLIVRNVSLRNNSCRRQVYNYRPNILLRLLGDPGYQVIRRNQEEELSFFSNFKLLHEGKIEGTGYTFYIFE